MPSENRFEKYPKLTVAASLLLLLPFIAVVGDLIFTSLVVDPWRDSFGPASPVRVASPIYHHDLKPNSRQEHETWGPYTYPLITNSLGFRDASTQVIALQTRHRRILLLGDSFTEGLGFEYEKTFAGRWQDSWRESGGEILNAAVTSYSPAIYYRKVKYLLENQGLSFDELVLFVDISDIQDETFYFLKPNNTVGRLPEDEVGRLAETAQTGVFGAFLKSHAALSFVLYRRVRCKIFGKCIRGATGLARARWTVDSKLFDFYGRQGVENAMRHLDRLETVLRRYRIPMTLVVYPWPDQILAGDLNSKQVAIWQAWSEKHQVRFLNLFPLFFYSERSPRENISKFFIHGDMHLSEAGHEMVFRAMRKAFPPR